MLDSEFVEMEEATTSEGGGEVYSGAVEVGDSWDDKFESYLIEDLIDELLKITPFSTNGLGKNVVSEGLDEALQAFVRLITSALSDNRKRLRSLCHGLLVHVDLYLLVLCKVISKIPVLTETKEYGNVFSYLKFIPLPNKKLQSEFFGSEVALVRPGLNNAKVRRLYQNAWLEFVKHKLPPRLLKQVVPYLCESALSAMREGYLFGDFLFRVFKMGDVFAVISLAGIFKLITEHNFEYPDFYPCVYKLTTPSVCYMSYRKQFFGLLNTFLSSTHLPTYIVAAFLKRLCRLTLLAPLACQEPLLGLIRNLATRHEGVRPLLHRDNPETVAGDPYNELEETLQNCGALDSSVWEIKTIQRHWCSEVAKRANFVDKGVQRMESFVRWKSEDEYFASMMSKKFGSDLVKHGDDVDYQEKQSRYSDEDEDSEGNEVPKKKRRKSYGKNANKNKEFAVPINNKEPTTDFLPDKFQFSLFSFWKT